MAGQPVPEDREVKAAIGKLQGYNTYKAKQLQAPQGDSATLEQALQTVETWANDATDDGTAWGQKKETESNQQIQTAETAQQQVRQTDEQAAKEAESRKKLDMNQVKADMKSQLTDYLGAMQKLADDDKPGFKEKLPELKQQVGDAKKFVDEDLEKSMDLAAQQNAKQRQQQKVQADKYGEQAKGGKQWKDDFAGRPAKLPEGQRADVQAALDQLNQLAADKITEIEPLGQKAAPHVEQLKTVQTWANELKPKVASQGKDLQAAKASGKSGAAHARESFAKIGAMQDSVESEANENADVYQRWTDHNNRLAKEWVNSDSPKHKQWAQEWLKGPVRNK